MASPGDNLDGTGYNAAVEGFRDDEYPMLQGEYEVPPIPPCMPPG